MYQNKKIVAIIPARSGSKRLTDKNIMEINKKPLIAHTIEACKRTEIFDDIIVSTDSKLYAGIAESFGASVPFLREESLASDTASSIDVIVSVLEQLKGLGKHYDSFMLLQPTSPLRNEKHIKESLEIFCKNKSDSVISICEQSCPTYLNVVLKQTKNQEKVEVSKLLKKGQIRRQDIKPEYRINGAIYIANVDFFMKYRCFYKGIVCPYRMEEKYSIDIDDEVQFRIAAFLMEEMYSNQRKNDCTR